MSWQVNNFGCDCGSFGMRTVKGVESQLVTGESGTKLGVPRCEGLLINLVFDSQIQQTILPGDNQRRLPLKFRVLSA